MTLLEIINTVAITYLATELYFSNHIPEFWSRPEGRYVSSRCLPPSTCNKKIWNKGMVVGLVIANTLYYLLRNSFSQWNLLEFAPTFGISDNFISAVVYAIVVASVIMLGGIGIRARDKSWIQIKTVGVLFMSSFLCAFTLFSTTNTLERLGCKVIYGCKVLACIITFLLVCYIDVWRSKSSLCLRYFILQSGKSLVFIAPALPLAAILISTVFMICVSVAENLLKIDPLILNWPIYYCTLYGPFALFYFRIKTVCLTSETPLRAIV